MQGEVGDKVVVKGHHVADPDREAVILAVEGDHGAPPYRVRWSHDRHEGIFFPGSDAAIDHCRAETLRAP